MVIRISVADAVFSCAKLFAKRILSKKRKKSLLLIGEIRKLYLTKKIELRKITVLFEVF